MNTNKITNESSYVSNEIVDAELYFKTYPEKSGAKVDITTVFSLAYGLASVMLSLLQQKKAALVGSPRALESPLPSRISNSNFKALSSGVKGWMRRSTDAKEKTAINTSGTQRGLETTQTRFGKGKVDSGK